MADIEISTSKVTSEYVELVFSGEAVKSGTIDARVLGTALTAFTDAFIRADTIVNGKKSEASIRVDAKFERGSFDVLLQLAQGLLGQAQGIISNLKTAFELAVLLGIIHKSGSLIDLLKFLRGKKPDKVVKGDETVDIELNGVKKTVNHITFNMYGDETIRKALRNGTAALEYPGIESITFKHKDAEPETIKKDEVPYFQTDDLELTEDEAHSGERDAVLTISKLSFKEGTKWSFIEGGSWLNAKIKDEQFFRDIHDRKVKFADGDRLRVHLKWELLTKGTRLVPENVITKVHGILPKKRQMRLDGEKDDLV